MPDSRRSALLPLAKAARDLLAQRLEQILERRSRAGLDEDLRRHSGQEAELSEPTVSGLRERHAYEIIRLSRSSHTRRVTREVGRDMNEGAAKLGHGSLIAGIDTYHRGCPNIDLIDLGRRHFRLHDQVVPARDDGHDGVAAANHSAHGVNGEGMDDAGTWCANVDAIELILRGDHSFGQFGNLALRVAQ